jgi:hypothetical protein
VYLQGSSRRRVFVAQVETVDGTVKLREKLEQDLLFVHIDVS